MFGDSTACAQVSKCLNNSSKSGACAMTTGCHGYRNASKYLGRAHAENAVANLADHAFFGLLEAYNASVLLAAHVFDVDLDDDDFAKSRESSQQRTLSSSSSSSTKKKNKVCSPQRVLRDDASACRAVFAAHAWDFYVYEKAHRIFCDRLNDAGLVGRPDVRRELTANRLCEDLDFSQVDHVCGLLETPDAVRRFLDQRDNCKYDEATWEKNYGFYWKPNPPAGQGAQRRPGPPPPGSLAFH
mmetsp:Transcript_8332/g.27288  ORF Transcript_8332/g.27288 Transcript_8332/m.27288 type:complete len:242 (-) Transcript_8332:196-921(-)